MRDKDAGERHGTCRHPDSARKPLNAWWDKCGKCGQDVRKRRRQGTTLRHGTWQGYYRHSRVRSGKWGWPACEGCAEGHREYRKELDSRESARATARIRGAARTKAETRLRHLYPADYAKLYAEELALLQGDVTLAVRGLESEISSILRAVYPGSVKYPEAVLRYAVADRTATTGEYLAWRRVQSLRQRIRELSEKAEPGQPG